MIEWGWDLCGASWYNLIFNILTLLFIVNNGTMILFNIRILLFLDEDMLG